MSTSQPPRVGTQGTDNVKCSCFHLACSKTSMATRTASLGEVGAGSELGGHPPGQREAMVSSGSGTTGTSQANSLLILQN